MFQARLLRGFLLRFAVLYGLLIAAWPGIKDVYGGYFRSTGELFLGSFGPKCIIRFEQEASPIKAAVSFDTKILIANREIKASPGRLRAAHYYTNSRYTGYMPTILVVALILASPIPLRRRLTALAWGIPLVHAFIIVKVAIAILCKCNLEEWLSLFVLDPFWKNILFSAQGIFGSIEVSLLVPVFIWIPVTFRCEDRRLLDQAAAIDRRHRRGSGGKGRPPKRGRG